MAHSHQQTLLSRLGFADPDHKDPRHTLACEYLCKPEVAEKIVRVIGYSLEKPEIPPDTIVSAYERPKITEKWVSKIIANMEEPVINTTHNSKFYIGFIDVCLFLRISHIDANHIGTTYKNKVHKQPCQYTKCKLCVGGNKNYVDERNMVVHKVGYERIVCSEHPACCSDRAPIEQSDGQRWHITATTKEQVEDKYIYSHYHSKDSVCAPVIIEVKTNRCDPADIIKQIKLYCEYMNKPFKVIATCYPVSQTTKDMFKREGIHHIFLGAGFEEYCKARRSEQPLSEEGL